MGEWRPDQRQQVRASTIFLWIVPARVEGQWRISAEGRTVTVDLNQDFQQVDGRVRAAAGSSRGRLAGTRIRFLVNLGDGRREIYRPRSTETASTPSSPIAAGRPSAPADPAAMALALIGLAIVWG